MHFSKTFKAYYGMSPSDYKKAANRPPCKSPEWEDFFLREKAARLYRH